MAGMFSSALRSFTSNISSNYKISDHSTSQAGPWRIFEGKHKSSGKAVSVFVFDKKVLEPNSGGFGRSSGGSLKKVHEEVVERLRKEASLLARLRHPSILELVEPVEDTRSGGLQFATEQITASLSGLLSEKDEQERENGVGGRSSRFVDTRDGTRKRREVEIDELDIQKGLLQIAKGIEFLHESAGLIHGNLTPNSIVVNAKGDWKITGLGFSGKLEGTTVATSSAPMALSEILNFDPRLPKAVQLNLDYASPDFIMDNNACQEADMFSLGLLLIALYNSPHQSPLEAKMSISSYKRLFASSSSVPTQSNNFLSSTPLAKPVQNVLARLITRRPAQRMNAKEFQQAEYFDNILVSTIRFLESLPAKTQNEKSQFLRGLPRIMPQFSNKVLERKVLPALLDEMKDRDLIALILQNMFKLLNGMSAAKRIFPEKVVPKLREVFLNATGKTGQADRDSAKEAGLMVLLDNMKHISEYTSGKEFKDDILPIIHFALESPTHSLVDAALGTLPVILSILDYSTIKNEVFPVIASVFSKTSSMGIKIRGLEALKTLCGGSATPENDDGFGNFEQTASKPKNNSVILDKYTIQEKVVPLLKAIKTKEPAVMTAALDVFQEIGKIADSDFLATDVLPVLWSFSLGPLLNLQQFQAYMTLIKGLSTRVEQEHTRKLQEMSTSNPTVASRNDFMSFGGLTDRNGLDDANGTTNDFEALVLGKKGLSSPAADSFDVWNNPEQIPSNQLPVQVSGQASPTPPAFSWSTPSASSTAQNNSFAKPANTSNPPLNAFSVLQPQSTSTTSFSSSQSIQPTNWSAPQTNAWSSQTDTTTPSLSFSNTWSSANAPLAPSNPWTSASQSHLQPSAFSQPLRPNTSTQSSFSIPPPPTSPYSTFGIAPPPTTIMSPMTGALNTLASSQKYPQPQQQRQQQQQQSGRKQGLDKYESLI